MSVKKGSTVQLPWYCNTLLCIPCRYDNSHLIFILLNYFETLLSCTERNFSTVDIHRVY